LGTSAAPDLKQFLERHACDLAGFESDDAGLDFDMDTPEDYERLRALHG
jgi:CTP:molybdopterin cytidylyltransferase MocA